MEREEGPLKWWDMQNKSMTSSLLPHQKLIRLYLFLFYFFHLFVALWWAVAPTTPTLHLRVDLYHVSELHVSGHQWSYFKFASLSARITPTSIPSPSLTIACLCQPMHEFGENSHG